MRPLRRQSSTGTSVNSGTIGWASVDGAGAADINQNLITGLTQPRQIDANGTHVYWAEYNARGIGRAGRDGTGVTHNLIDVPRPAGLAVSGSHVFWASESDRIGRANLDGTNPDGDFIDAAFGPRGLAARGGRLYWGAFNNTIAHANVDGTDIGLLFADGANSPYVTAVDGTYVYFSNFADRKIGRALLAGGHFEEDFITDVVAFGVAVDDDYIYWTDPFDGMIGRAKLDGTEVNRSFIIELETPFDVAVAPAAPADTAKPVCGSLVVRRGGGPGGADQGDVTITDSGSGIASITNFTVSNGTFSIPAFSPGAGSVTVTATKTTPGVPTSFSFDVTDAAGNTIHCR